LKFAGPASAPLAQNTYSFSHKNMGSFEMFIVPSGTTGSMIQYQAIFNRINS
jgi:hypothetical protein